MPYLDEPVHKQQMATNQTIHTLYTHTYMLSAHKSHVVGLQAGRDTISHRWKAVGGERRLGTGTAHATWNHIASSW